MSLKVSSPPAKAPFLYYFLNVARGPYSFEFVKSMADGIEAQDKLMRELATQYSITCNADLKIGGLGRGLFAQQVSDHVNCPHQTRRC